MTRSNRQRKIKLAFEQTSLRIQLGEIELLRAMPESTRKSPKYGQIAASITEVGIIEPPVVVRVPGKDERYRLLDGHIRIDILKARGDKDVVCLVATDDEAITYNKRISRMAIVQDRARRSSETPFSRAFRIILCS